MMISILAKQLLREAMEHFPTMGSPSQEQLNSIQAKIQTQLEATIAQAQLVSRTEFDTQKAALARANEQLKMLEEKLIALEQSKNKEA